MLNWFHAAIACLLFYFAGTWLFDSSIGVDGIDGIVRALAGQAFIGCAFGVIVDMILDYRTRPQPLPTLIGALVFVGGWGGGLV